MGCVGCVHEYKISVFMGNDNPYVALWTLIGAKLFARDTPSGCGTSPLIGFSWSNSVNNETMEITAEVRQALGFEDVIRFEHHIVETYKSIVRQPYNRRDELIEIAAKVANVSAKHEGGDPEIDCTREHPSDILDYFWDKAEIEAAGDMPHLLRNYLDRHDAVNATAWALTEHGLSFVAARKLHHTQLVGLQRRVLVVCQKARRSRGWPYLPRFGSIGRDSGPIGSSWAGARPGWAGCC